MPCWTGGGLKPQKTLQRACQRDPQAIERWQREVFPDIARQARQDGADIFFWDESDFRADTVHGKSWGLRGHTPVVQRSNCAHIPSIRSMYRRIRTMGADRLP